MPRHACWMMVPGSAWGRWSGSRPPLSVRRAVPPWGRWSGHASLLRTVIGGANIIDVMILVIDAVKGMQTQTAECLVVGELLTDKMLVVLNKADLLPAES